jgi:folate-dependent phosphoribosylglycinamide formyltransferase PurN
MNLLNKRFWFVLTPIICIAILSIGALYRGSYLRAIIAEEPISLNGTAVTYDCANGNCIGFKVAPSSTKGYVAEYKDRLIIPYREDHDRDSLENNWAHLLNTPNSIICLKGYMHIYSVDTLRIVQAGYAGFRFKLLEYSEARCNTEVNE